jgi:hypothetical protein
MSWVITGSQKFTPNALLDQFTGAAAAYSLRNLVGASNPSVVRVRRSSDNTEQDFTATQVTDGTLTTFCGAGDGFVRTWYDQSGNNQHAIQATTASQPKIVDGSTGLILENGKPGISFDGSNDFLQATGLNVSQPCSIVTVVKKTNTSHYFDGATSRITLFGSTSQLFLIAGAQLGTNTQTDFQCLFFVTADATDTVHVNSVQRISGNAGSNALTSLLLGRQTTGLNHANQTMQDFIVYPSNQSTNRTAIESNINAHYAIY